MKIPRLNLFMEENQMNNAEELNTQLYEKMKAEQDKYRDWLLTQSPAEIINHTYEYTIREDIVIFMEEAELTPKQAKVLLKSPCPLGDCYEIYRDREDSKMDDIRESVEDMANRIVREDFMKAQRESR